MSAIHVNEENFETEVLHSDKPVLLDFFATWCGPCRMLGPVLEEIANERTDIKVCKVDIDQAPDLANEFKVMSVPTVFAIKHGKIIGKTMGVQPKRSLLAMV